MKFGTLIEYKMKNICLGKSYTKCGGERGVQLGGGGGGVGALSPRPYFENRTKSPLIL